MNTNASGPLQGLRVVDFSNSTAGAQSTQTLADFGAEVVFVEPPGASPLRGLPAFAFLGRGKQSITLVETFRPGVMDGFGLGFDDLRNENAGLAHVSVPFCSYRATQTLLTGTFTALHERKSSGLGQRVDTSLVKGLPALGTWNWYLNVVTSKFPDAFTPSSPVSDAGVPLLPMFFMLLIERSAPLLDANVPDEAGLTIEQIRSYALRLTGAGTTEYAQADGISALTAASAMALGLYVRDRTGTAQSMLTTMLTSSAQEWEDRLPAADVGCVVAHSEPPEVVLQSPEFGEAQDLLVEVEHPTFGEHQRMKTLVELSRSATVANPGVLCGQHTDEILTELGHGAAAIADLRERKIVA